MATTDYLADPADLAAWLPVGEDDPKLLAALAAASSRFRGAVRHRVSFTVDDVITVDGNGSQTVLLPAAPVTAVSELLLDDVELIEGTDFNWSADGYVRRLGGCWPDRLRCLQVTYSHGYDEVPEEISEAVIDRARLLYAVKAGVQNMQVGGITVGFGQQSAMGVSQQWTDVVDRYRLNAGDRP